MNITANKTAMAANKAADTAPRMTALKRLTVLFLCLSLCLSLCGCSSRDAQQNDPTQPYAGLKLTLALQYGMQYAPVYVMQELGLLEQELPGIETEYVRLGSGSAMNEALISGTVDAAFMGIPPALIAASRGAEQHILCGICVPPNALMCTDNSLSSLSDLGAEDRIALPGIGSIQHILLAMACLEQLGDAHALDGQLVAMSNPDAAAALLSGGEISAHFAAMPYAALEAESGCTAMSGVGEQGASIVCVCGEVDELILAALSEALYQAVELINKRDERALAIIAAAEKMDTADVLTCLDWPGTEYTTDIVGLSALADFMLEQGFIDSAVDIGTLCRPSAVLREE